MIAAPPGLAASIATTAIASPDCPASALKNNTTATAAGAGAAKCAVTAKIILLATTGVVVFGTIASIHVLRYHPELTQWLHQWLRQ
jgi:hypothetical protein